LNGAKAYTLDPSAPEADVKRATKEALKIYERIDVLVNNAGYGQPGVVEDLRLVFHILFRSSERILSL
jgi:NAD(P)-dependent dehydrogenase (short-subunit alcohol dehydrogenase family)